MLFNWNFYVNKYTNLLYLRNERDALIHFLKYGKNNKLIYIDIPIYFNWKHYIDINNLDYINNEEEAWRHFLYNGNNPDIKIINPLLKIYCV